MARPDWMVPGAVVVEYTPHRRGHTAHMVTTTIDRVMKRDVVLANGNRYNADRPYKTRGAAWDPDTELLAADDTKVERARAANAKRRLLTAAVDDVERIGRLLRELDGGFKRTTETPHAELAERLGTLTHAIDKLAETKEVDR
jgi:hypothetical protein